MKTTEGKNYLLFMIEMCDGLYLELTSERWGFCARMDSENSTKACFAQFLNTKDQTIV